VLLVIRTKSADLRTGALVLDSYLLRLRKLGGISLQILIILHPSPYQDFEGAVLGTGLHKIYVIVLRDLLSGYRLQALRTKALCLPDLLTHVFHQKYSDRTELLLFYFSETSTVALDVARKSPRCQMKTKKNLRGRDRGPKCV
jgi:hypothetical protein